MFPATTVITVSMKPYASLPSSTPPMAKSLWTKRSTLASSLTMTATVASSKRELTRPSGIGPIRRGDQATAAAGASMSTSTSVPWASVLCAGQLRATRSSSSAYCGGSAAGSITRTM